MAANVRLVEKLAGLSLEEAPVLGIFCFFYQVKKSFYKRILYVARFTFTYRYYICW